MNVSLSLPLEEYINEKVKSGMYNSASEVIREGLRTLQEKDKLKAEALDNLLMERLAKYEAGEAGIAAEDVKRNIINKLKKETSSK